MAKRILLVDDEPLIVKGLKFALESVSYPSETANRPLKRYRTAISILYCWTLCCPR